MTSEMDRWKQKYFDKLEEFETRESDFNDRIHVLQRMVVRISLAAEGLDPSLDRELEKLRNIVRRDDSAIGELGNSLEIIEKSVLAMDQSRLSTAEGVLKALSELVDQLLVCDLSKSQTKALKQFSRQLGERVKDLRQYPRLLAEYARFNALALQELMGKDSGEPKAGFFSRLFAGGDSRPAPVDSVGTAAEPSQRERGTANGGQESSAYTLDVARPEEPSASLSRPENFEPGFSAIADHVSVTLNFLVDQLQLPTTMETDAEKVRQRINAGLNWYELVPTLDDIANLVIAAFGRGQQEFEAFLKTLNDRLTSIQSFLESSRNSQQEARANSTELGDAVRAQVSTLQESLRDARDIEELKTSVTGHLDSILSSLTTFVSKETHREQTLSEEMEELQARLRTMESDSREMQKKLMEEQQRAVTDVLTGLPNRVAYESRAQQEYERWRRYGGPLTLVVADIDHFKKVNDDYGHLAGDKVIQLIGKEIASRIRKTDFIARYGGEEFVILLPETDRETAAAVMEKTREMVSRLPFHFRNERVQITLSMGVCEFAGNATLTGVFEQADKALYRAKNQGRNRVEAVDAGAFG